MSNPQPNNVNFQRRRRAFFKKALEVDGDGFVFLPEELQRDEGMVWSALNSQTCKYIVPTFLEHLHELFKSDREFMMKLMYKVGTEGIRFASQALRADREFVLDAAKRYGHNVFLSTRRSFSSWQRSIRVRRYVRWMERCGATATSS